MLSIENVSVYYGKIQVLFDVNLRVTEGELVALIGANGAGKSTLINAVSGLVVPRKGRITFRGEKINGMSADKIVQRGITQVAEGRELFPALSVRENLMMGAYTCRNRREIDARLASAFDLFPVLKKKVGDSAQTLSGGEQQMLAIGRGLMSRPKLMMLDEPSFGLAPMLVVRMFDVVIRLNRELGLPVLLVEQNVALALKNSTRGYVIENGRLTMEDESAELLTNPAVEKAYMGI
jgi:branched-chain amino acid transport system ATP-binding protein